MADRGHLFARPDAPHRVHDLLLVAAWAAGDATGPDSDRAKALVEACGECAALVDDLRTIQRATPTLPAPERPRDFRLTAEDARRLRPTGLRGFVTVVRNPSLSRAKPVAAGLTMLGMAGLLATTISIGGPKAVPAAGGSAGSAPISAEDRRALEAAPADSPGTDLFAVSAAPEGTAGVQEETGDTAAGGAPEPTAEAQAAPAGSGALERDAEPPAAPPGSDGGTVATTDTRLPVALVSSVLVVAGLLLFLLSDRQRRRAG